MFSDIGKMLQRVFKIKVAKTSSPQLTKRGEGMSSERLTDPVRANTGDLASKAADLPVQASTNRDVCCKLLEFSGEKEVAGAPQRYCDKSQTTV